MAGLFPNNLYTKEGKGIEKDTPKKEGIFLFFQLYFRKLWGLFKLNLLYVLFAIPTAIICFFVFGIIASILVEFLEPFIATAINADGLNFDLLQTKVSFDYAIRIYLVLIFTVLFGMGPATCGFTYIVRNFSQEKHTWVFSDFIEHSKNNFKQSIILWVIDILACILFFYAYYFYSTSMQSMMVFKYAIVIIVALYSMMHFYIYPMMVTFKLSLKNIYKNSLLLVLVKLPQNILTFLIVTFIHIGIPYLMIYNFTDDISGRVTFIMLEAILLISTTGFIINFNSFPVIKKYMFSEKEDV